MAEFQLGLRRYVEERRDEIVPRLSPESAVVVFHGLGKTSKNSGSSDVSSSCAVTSPSLPQPDNLEGRKTIVIKSGATKNGNAPALLFHLSESISVGTKKIMRVANDPCGGSFDVINLRRAGKDGKSKQYEFSFLESHAVDIYESCLRFMQTSEPPNLMLPPSSALPKKEDGGYDLTGEIGRDVHPKLVYKVADLSVFMEHQFGGWHMVVRKYKTKVRSHAW